MKLHTSISLRTYNTFGIDLPGNLAEFDSEADLLKLMEAQPDGPSLILGGGSNMLFSHPPAGWIWKNSIPGIRVLSQTEDFVIVEAGAGENWHGFVQHCIANDWGGLENLSLIPGQVGASPMQNIGAYGVEVKDVFDSLCAVELSSGNLKEFSAEACAFGYRESVFKRALKNQFMITAVRFKLSRRNHKLHLDYGAIREELEKMEVTLPGIKDVAQAVIQIRRSKLPDPRELGNAGSFFKNPVIDSGLAQKLKMQYPEMVQYPIDGESVKLAAGWLIEKAGWKGYRKGDAGVHAKQALVLVNYGNADGQEIWQLSEDIVRDIEQKFGVVLEREVNIC
jgi:UDP-N-acetylmuramate dehydrogenase